MTDDTWSADTCKYSTAGEMCLSSKNVTDVSHISISEYGEWLTRGLIALKASRRNPASKGEAGGKYCSRTRSLSKSLSTSIGTWKTKGRLIDKNPWHRFQD